MWIRPAQDKDMKTIGELEKVCLPAGDVWSEVLISNMFSNSYDKIFVIEEEGAVRGYINIRDIGGDVDLMSICVSPEYQRRGYAGLLMERVLALPYKQMILEVRESNGPAISLYEKFGFEKYARRSEYYTNPVEDAIIMIKKPEQT
ncbi:MAG: ribosomal protein S18-alanine N-acetyltransferase [Lachnospiraceae bacterium]|nr:ribosomal protein S18-alanine N-acetyltransferase [Lachnospiraceae bacterium]